LVLRLEIVERYGKGTLDVILTLVLPCYHRAIMRPPFRETRMERTIEAQIEILAESRSWSATPDNYSSKRYLTLGRDGSGEIVYAYGQTIYAKIACRFEIPAPGRIRFEYLETPQLQGRPPFIPDEDARFKEIDFSLDEGDVAFKEDVTGSGFTFSWTLMFSESPYPSRLALPYEVPRVFYGYRVRIDPPPGSDGDEVL
jgi:hypothetical protein